MIECSTCKECKQQDEFPKNGKHKDGTTRYRTDCKKCYNITRKLTHRKAVTKFLNNTKKRTGEVNTYSLKDWRDAMIHFKGSCAYCGTPQTRGRKLTRDHIKCVAEGGLTVRTNIAPACRSCNSSKGDTPWEDWIKQKKFYNEQLVDNLKKWVDQK